MKAKNHHIAQENDQKVVFLNNQLMLTFLFFGYLNNLLCIVSLKVEISILKTSSLFKFPSILLSSHKLSNSLKIIPSFSYNIFSSRSDIFSSGFFKIAFDIELTHVILSP